jgi:hypothetical protein
MTKLNDNWFTEGMIDLEYQQYILMAYLQNIKKSYQDFKLYPHLSDLISHHKNLIQFMENRSSIYKAFPKELKSIDIIDKKLIYEQKEESDIFKTIWEIIEFSLPLMQKYIDLGKTLYETIEKNIILEPIGLIPIYKKEGYILLSTSEETKVYRFNISSIIICSEKMVGISIDHIETYFGSIQESSAKVKLKLIQKNKELPNPATYFVKVKKEFSNIIEETILPIIKRKTIIQS